MSGTSTPVARTLVVAVGTRGLAVLRAFQARWAARGGRGWPVACVALMAGPKAPDPPDADATVHLAASEAVGEALARQAGEVAAALDQALARISRVPQGVEEPRQPRLQEIEVYLVAGLDDPAAEILADLAYLVRHVLRRRWHVPARISGLLLWPDPPVGEGPGEAAARAQAALAALDTAMAFTDGYRRAYGEDWVVEGWGPPFDGPCFLVAALNRDGRRMEEPQAREQLVAEALLQFVTAAVRPRRLALEAALMATGRAPGYAGLGLACLVYPARPVHERLSRRLAREILTAWAAAPQGTGPDEADAAAFLVEQGLSPAQARSYLLPPEVLDEAGVGRPITVERPWEEADTLREALEEIAAQRRAVLEDRRPGLEEAAEVPARALEEALAAAVREELTAPQPGGLARRLDLVRALKAELRALQAEGAAALAASREKLEALRAEGETPAEDLAQIGREITALWPTTPRAVGAFLLRPSCWLYLWRLTGALERAKARYVQHLELQLEWEARVLEAELWARCVQEAASRVEGWEQRLSRLVDAVQAAVRELEGEVPEEHPGFDLEWSVLTAELVEALYREHVAEPAEELREFARAVERFPTWGEEPPDALVVREAALNYARRRLLPLLQTTVGQVLAWRYREAEERREVLEKLFDAATAFIVWDETALPANEPVRETAVLGVPAQDLEAVAAVLDSSPLRASLVPLQDPHRIVVVRVVQGIPAAALPFAQAAAAGSARPQDKPSRDKAPVQVETLEEEGT